MKWKRFHLEHTDFKKKGIYKYLLEEVIKIIYIFIKVQLLYSMKFLVIF